jgi:hypothetical protein
LREALHPEIEWFPFEENHSRIYGVEDDMQNRNEWLDTWDEHHFDLEEVIVEGNSVVALIHITARGKTAVWRSTFVSMQIKVTDSKVIYIFDHQDRAAALQAAGLAE